MGSRCHHFEVIADLGLYLRSKMSYLVPGMMSFWKIRRG